MNPLATLELKESHAQTLKLRATESIASQLDNIEKLNTEAEVRFKGKLFTDTTLSRSLVSFQANKSRAVYRWYKYKEGFSTGLIEFLLSKYCSKGGRLLDPFAGSGTALFTASGLGIKSDGIELLPIGQTVIETRKVIDSELRETDIKRLSKWISEKPWQNGTGSKAVNELRITRGAYPSDTLTEMALYLSKLEDENPRVRAVLKFALLCILESISYTRKDGQYLRWDHRSGRRLSKRLFDKGTIHKFESAITNKLHEIVNDLSSMYIPDDLFATKIEHAEILLHKGSCLDILQNMKKGSFQSLITSPPYCNRYDYTRTYALELALLGVDETELSKLRQSMVSCTVENRAKDLLSINPNWKQAISTTDSNELLQSILTYLESEKERGTLNNSGIPRMVRGYFYEMSCVIAECARILKPGSPFIMINDNVRYAGAGISVDIILSEIAQGVGFETEKILVLPTGKGNSSQQMGEHGRESLRKCIYIWRKI